MQVVDLHKNSAIVVCPECRGPYIVTESPEPDNLRKCPHCNTDNEITYEEAVAAMGVQYKPQRQNR